MMSDNRQIQRGNLMSASQSTATPASTRRSSSIWRHWPVAIGLLGAAFAAIAGANRETVVISLLVALLCYLAAAALGVKWVAWAAIPVASALVAAGALIGIEPWFVLGGVCDCSCDRRSGGSGVPDGSGRTVPGTGGVRGNRADRARALTCGRRRSCITDSDGACRLGRHSLPAQCCGIPLACRGLHRLRCAPWSSRHRSCGWCALSWSKGAATGLKVEQQLDSDWPSRWSAASCIVGYQAYSNLSATLERTTR